MNLIKESVIDGYRIREYEASDGSIFYEKALNPVADVEQPLPSEPISQDVVSQEILLESKYQTALLEMML